MARPIILADDHPLFRSALRSAIQRVRPDAPVEEVATLAEARNAVVQSEPLLLCLDLHMDDSHGFAGLIGLRQDFPALPVVVISGSETADVGARAVRFGASGFIPKSSTLETMCDALGAILDGDVWLPPSHGEPIDSAVDDAAQRLAALTPAQLRVLVALTEGRLNKQIAFDMGISEATVKAHVTAIFRKLGVGNRTQAVIAAGALQVGASTPREDA